MNIWSGPLIRNAAPAPAPDIQSAVSLINTELYSK